MSSIVWERKISKGNSKGTGWLTLPKELEDNLELGAYYNISLNDKEVGSLEMLLKLVDNKGYLGFYIPKKICDQHSLIKKKIEVIIEDSEFFPGQVPTDRRVYLPYSIINRYGLKEDELYEVEIIANGMVFGEVVIVSKTDRSKAMRKDEYAVTIRMCEIPKNVRVKVKFIRKIEILSPVVSPFHKGLIYLPSLIHNTIMGEIGPNEMIIFKGNHVPIITPITIQLKDYIHYFGCYHADGTKVGPGWSISASTPEQAKLYIKKFNKLVFSDTLDYVLVYSQKPSDKRALNEVKLDLKRYWKQEADIDLKIEKIRILKTKTKNPLKWNECGSLRICSYKTQVLDLHLGLLGEIVDYLKNIENEEDLWQFLFGILEGDGNVSGGKGRFGVGFSCHVNDEIIRHSLEKLGLKFSVDLSRIRKQKGSGIHISFWLFEVLTNLEILYENLFLYYPKRRKYFIERLLNQSTVKYLLGQTNILAPISKKFFTSEMIDLDNLRIVLNELRLELLLDESH